MKKIALAENVYWVGAVDWISRDFHGYSINGTTYNAYLIEGSEKTALLDAVDMTVKSEGWKKVLADKKWTDLYMPGDEFGALIASENARITDVLKTIGLIK